MLILFGAVMLFASLYIKKIESSSYPSVHDPYSNISPKTKIKYPYAKRNNRKEGIIERKRKLFGDQKIDLISASIVNLEATKNKIENYNCAFYVNEQSRIKLEIRELETNYKMEPLKKDYIADLHTFSWPSTIPLHYKIGLHDLLPLARILGARNTTVVPVVLYYDKPINSDVVYNFCILPQYRVKRLIYSIYEATSNSFIFSNTLFNLPRAKMQWLKWNGRNFKDEAIHDGNYYLSVRCLFSSRKSKKDNLELTWNYNFYHFSNLLNHKKLRNTNQ